MNSKLILNLLVTILALCVAQPSFADAQQTKIKKYTKQLQNLPNQGAMESQVSSLVKKLIKLEPTKTSQYYALGLRKLGQSGYPGKEYSSLLNDQIQKLIKKSDLTPAMQAQMVRRLNKIQRLYVAPDEPNPPQVSPSAMNSKGVDRTLS